MAAADARVLLHVKSGQGLYDTDLVGKMDPYCRVSLGGETKETEVIKEGGSNPVWEGDSGKLELPWAGEEELQIVVMDRDEAWFDEDDCVGNCAVKLASVQRTGGFDGDLTVYRNGTNASGTLRLEITLENLPDLGNKGGDGAVHQSVAAKFHRNTWVGGALSLSEGDTLTSFCTYEMALHKTAEIFGDVEQKNYDESHAKIFADDANGCAIRTVIKTEHATLYRDGVRPGWLRPEGQRTEKLSLCSGDAFLRMIGGGQRDGKRRVYTYSILDWAMRFAETGAVMSKDACSKHAVHANAEAAVRYSGTFRICEDTSGSPVMVFDNDSGTYRPHPDHLPLVKQLLEANFPGLNVMGLSVLSDQPEETKELAGPNEGKGDPESVYAGAWVWRQ
mmetsp:Transcript_51821/g.116718  ORF Transcript_51821/g.116718 Transcript_51821/m.116718 type:complete len:391 (+) Transcript_51821:117-1289(+)